MYLPDREEESRVGLLGKGFVEHSGIGEAEIVHLAEDDVVKYADAGA